MNHVCPRCGKTSSSKEWNEATSVFYDSSEITLIESDESTTSNFVCPKCEKLIEWGMFKCDGSHYITIPKQEYKELLEIKAMYEGLCK